MEKVNVINLDNEVVGTVTIHEVHERRLPHRTSQVLIFSTDQKRIFLQKRGPNVFIYPGFWTTSASGHVSAGMNYNDTAYKELKEELGIRTDLQNIGYYWIDEGDNIERNEVFAGYFDGPFVFTEQDVPGGEWFEIEEIDKNIDKIKVCPYFKATWKRWKESL
ncbi:MAG TPA: NUDIX domain-containing protein [bacterium]|nr:NUDIX domain-containing protein [bacterium]